MMTHTKGPWKAENTNKGIFVVGKEPGYLANVLWYKNDSEGVWANAYLIAAAPDLLEALEAVLPWASKAVADHYNEAIGKRALNKAHAAIAKTKGKTNETDN